MKRCWGEAGSEEDIRGHMSSAGANRAPDISSVSQTSSRAEMPQGKKLLRENPVSPQPDTSALQSLKAHPCSCPCVLLSASYLQGPKSLMPPAHVGDTTAQAKPLQSPLPKTSQMLLPLFKHRSGLSRRDSILV